MFPSSKSSLLCLSRLVSLTLSRSFFVVNSGFIFSMVPIYFIHPPLLSLCFLHHVSIPLSVSRSLPSNLLPPNNLSCLISLFPATFYSAILLFHSSQLCVSLSSFALCSSLSVSLAMLSTKEVISLLRL